MSLDIEINSKTYALVEDRDGTKVATRPVQEFVQPIRQTGRTRPEDVAPYESFVIPNLTRGFGRKRINSDSAFNPDEYRRFFDSTCETRWMDSIYLPILAESSTDTNWERIKASAHFAGELNALWNDASSTIVVNRQYTGGSTTWENGGDPFPALTLDAEQAGGGNNASSVTISHTVAVKPHRLLIALIASTAVPSGVTYGGTALTKLEEATSTSRCASIWYLAHPATGANDLVSTTGGTNDQAIQIFSYYGCNPQDIFNTDVETTTSGSANHSSSLSVTSESGDIVVDIVASSGTVGFAPGASQTEVMDRTQDNIDGASSHETATGTSTTMSWDLTSSDGYSAHIGVAIKKPDLKIGLDMIAHKSNLVALAASDTNHMIATSTDGVTWVSPTTPITNNLLTDSVTAQEELDGGLLASIGGELVAAVWHESNGTITFFSSTDGGTVFADENIDIGSDRGPLGLVTYPDIDGTDKLYLGTAQGLYVIDTAPSTWTFDLIHAMPYSTDNCRRMTIHQGSIWFAQGVSNDEPAPIYKLTVQGDSRVIESGFGLSYGDGVPDDLLGPVKDMVSSADFLYIAVGGGAANRHSRICAWNARGWHSIHKHATADEPIEWIDVGAEDDSKQRLHFAIKTATAKSTSKFLAYPNTNPSSGVAVKYEAYNAGHAGHIDLPYYDLGYPHEDKNFTRVHIIADDLNSSAADEFIEASYGHNNAVRTSTDIGDFLSTVTGISLGSNAGVQAKNIGLRVILKRGSTNTDTPKLRDIVVEGYVVPNTAYEHNLTIDLEQTATDTGQSVETVISNLQTLISTVTLVDFKFGQVSKKVAVDRDRSSFSFGINSWESSGAPNALANRTGTATLTLIEKVAS